MQPGAGNYMDQALTPVSDDGDETLEQRDGSINGNTAASIAMTASRFTSNMRRHVGSKAPDCSGALLSKVHPPSKECQYLLPLFGAAMVPAPEPASSWSDGFAPSPFLAPLRVLDPVVMPFSCFVFLPEVAPGPTFPSLDAPGAGWL
jgi:hypothetical protein